MNRVIDYSSLATKPIFPRFLRCLSYHHHRIEDESIQFRFLYSSDIFHTIVIKLTDRQVVCFAPIVVAQYFHPMRSLFSFFQLRSNENCLLEPIEKKQRKLFSLSLSPCRHFFPVRERKKNYMFMCHPSHHYQFASRSSTF